VRVRGQTVVERAVVAVTTATLWRTGQSNSQGGQPSTVRYWVAYAVDVETAGITSTTTIVVAVVTEGPEMSV